MVIMKLDFVVNYIGRPYRCYREITGTRRLRQKITVDGYGSFPDPAVYASQSGHPTAAMAFAAQAIALEILDLARARFSRKAS
jgi:hypothetical protein